MARVARCRKVCQMPKTTVFHPEQKSELQEEVVLTIEEYECIRLIDKEGFSQEECGKYMEVARTTAQQIYADARKKIALALVEGRVLRIQGGCYKLCSGEEEFCGCGGCKKHAHCRKEEQR